MRRGLTLEVRIERADYNSAMLQSTHDVNPSKVPPIQSKQYPFLGDGDAQGLPVRNRTIGVTGLMGGQGVVPKVAALDDGQGEIFMGIEASH
jgi:hypothetical protein